MTRILQIVHSLAISDIHVTKRDLFYTDVKLFQDQKQSDDVLDDVACMVGCTRTSLNGLCLRCRRIACTQMCSVVIVVASEKGIVVGRLKFRESGMALVSVLCTDTLW